MSIIDSNLKLDSLTPLPWHSTAMLLLKSHRLVCLVGPPGGGKTEFAHAALWEITGKEPVTFNSTSSREGRHLTGSMWLRGGTSTVADVGLAEALRCHRALLLDDFGQLNLSSVLTELLPLRETHNAGAQRKYRNPESNEELVIPPNFRIVACSNLESLSNTCKRGSETARALFDRFVTLEVDAIDTEFVGELIEKALGDVHHEIVSEAIARHQSFSSVGKDGLSLRPAIDYAKCRIDGLSAEQATTICFVNKFVYDSNLHSAAKLRATLNFDDTHTKKDIDGVTFFDKDRV